ncbi:hypothetical protein LTR93_010721 [Exophiala xenobiotica]|nr:hypothetical protein LTR93_010721 [Exophiala xenobiotica]
MGNVAFGYPAAIIGTALSQPSFLIYMGLITKHGLTADANGLIGAMNGVFQDGALFGIFAAEMVMDRWGRKMAVLYTVILSLVGAALVTPVRMSPCLLLSDLSPVPGQDRYNAELAPPHWRGFFVGMNGMLIATGYAFAAYMGLAFNSIQNNPEAQWRGPLGMTLVFPAFMILNVGNNLHHAHSDQGREFARQEFYQTRKQIEMDRTLDNSWKHMFQKPSYRKRSMLAIEYVFLRESTAVLVIKNYASGLCKQLEYNSHQQICLQAGYHTVPTLRNLVGTLLMDRIGRRPLMLLGLGAAQ